MQLAGGSLPDVFTVPFTDSKALLGNGELMDETGKCIADQGGVAEAHAYLAELQAAGATFYPAYDDMANGLW